MPQPSQSDPDSPGITRRRRGTGFSYNGPSGRAVDAATRERVAALAIPPAWTDVWICPDEAGHIQAVGTDDAGRRQYLYHPDWVAQQDADKHERTLRLARRLPSVRRRITRDLRRPRLGRDRVVAGVLRMLDTGAFRTGGELYAEEHGTRGVSTLERTDVTVSGSDLRFRYPAKSGVPLDVTLRDADLAALVLALRRVRPGTERLFVYHDEQGWHEVRADLVNERFKTLAGDDYTVKDLRTWQATVRAAVFLAEEAEEAQDTGSSTDAERRHVLAEVMRRVAEDLGNTPAVARGSYVDPRVVDAAERQRTIASALDRIGSADLARPRTRAAVERSVIRLLERQ